MKWLLLATFTILFARAQTRPGADLLVRNAKVWTGDPSRPSAEAVAAIGERIVAVGTNAAVDAWRGANTRVIDAAGKLLVPGFNDAHLHFPMGGMQLDQVELKDAATPEEFARRIGERARSTPPGEWVLGGGWDEQRWPGAPLPARELIDRVAPRTPVFVGRYDGHMAVANSAALELAKLTANTPDPPGGLIVRDAQGRPTGVLKDAAISFVERVIPRPSRERRLRAIRRAMEHAASLGVTSVQDMGPDAADAALYGELAERGELTVRIYVAGPIERWEDQARAGIRRAFGSPWLRLGGVKGFADGSLGSSTAYFFRPYDDAPATRGLLMQPVATLREWIRDADAAALQPCIHAIGDEAISTVLDAFRDAAAQNGARDRRFRIEHAQHLAPPDFDRMALQKVIASVQPYHAIDDGRWAERRIGRERIQTTYAFRTFLDRGITLALGTDWPVAPLAPLETIYAAVTRATLDDRNPGGWVPEQKITVEEALRAYTAGSAFAEFQERDKGTLAPGRLGDMTLLGTDILEIAPAKIREVKVELTIVGGRVVWPGR